MTDYEYVSLRYLDKSTVLTVFLNDCSDLKSTMYLISSDLLHDCVLLVFTALLEQYMHFAVSLRVYFLHFMHCVIQHLLPEFLRTYLH